MIEYNNNYEINYIIRIIVLVYNNDYVLHYINKIIILLLYDIIQYIIYEIF